MFNGRVGIFGGRGGGGSGEVVTAPPANTVAPSISGGTGAGDVLTANPGGWANRPTSYSYQWKANGTNISGATSNTYTVLYTDTNKVITCAVSATNPIGTSSAVGSSNSLTIGVLTGNERIVARGGVISSNKWTYGAYSSFTSRTRGVTGRQPVKSLRIIYWNGYTNEFGERADLPNVTLEQAIERIDGTPQTVVATFGGASTKVLAGGEYAVSDPIYPQAFGLSVFPAGWDFRIRQRLVTATGVYPALALYQFEAATGVGFVISNATTSQVSGTGNLATESGAMTGAVTSIGPLGIIGEWAGTPDAAVLVYGDSIVSWQNDALNGASGGFVSRALNTLNLPYIKVSRPGEQATTWTQYNSNAMRKQLMAWSTHYLDNLGVNDLSQTTRTAQQIIASKTAIYADFKANGQAPKRIVHVPVATHTTSTDSYATLANQTLFSSEYSIGGERDQVNANILGMMGGSSGPDEVIDTTLDWIDQATNKWVVNGTANFTTADGVHPTTAAHIAAAARVQAAATNWTG